MPDDKGRYGSLEQRTYQPPPCPHCGSGNVTVTWVPATDISDPPGLDAAIPGTMRCLDCRGQGG